MIKLRVVYDMPPQAKEEFSKRYGLHISSITFHFGMQEHIPNVGDAIDEMDDSEISTTGIQSYSLRMTDPDQDDIKGVMDDDQASTELIWNLLVNYGFMTITDRIFDYGKKEVHLWASNK
ncbi:MAG TPA: hypothetical protein VK666_07895 [Chryseolinea sp.]|nr:hypothetical protein [Chryseolinea sp.]